MGITDKNLQQAEKIAKQHGIPKVYASIDELLSDRDVEIADVAVYPAQPVEIVAQATAAGKHLLRQTVRR